MRGQVKKRCLVDWAVAPQIQEGSGTLAKLWACRWALKSLSHLVLFSNISDRRGRFSLVVVNLFLRPWRCILVLYLNELRE